MTAHARIGPSSLSRVRLCPGSVKANDGHPSVTNRAAAEGSVLHDVAADCLEFGLEPWDFHSRTIVYGEHEFEMGDGEGQTNAECMVEVLDWAREQPGEMFIERQVSLDPWMPGQFGRLDLGIYTPNLLTVVDLKFGYVIVPIVNNEQVQAYAIGLVRLLREQGYKIPKRIRLIIEQPRSPGAPRYFQPWEITLDELMAFTGVMESIWTAANDPDAPRVAGEKQCRFCEAKDRPGGCQAHSEFLLDLASQKFEDMDEPERELVLPPAGVITPARRSFIVKHGPMFKSWIDQLAADTLADALAGNETPALKAVDGPLGDRRWIDPEAAEALLVGVLADDAFNKKLKSPPQSEKLLKPSRKSLGYPVAWAALEALIDRPEGKPILVSAEDPRPAKILADDKFDEEPETP